MAPKARQDENPGQEQPAVDAEQASAGPGDPGPARVREREARDAAERSDPPHHYYADSPLMAGDPAESGTGLVRAFNPGDPVLPADVWRHGWRDQVHPPDDYTPREGVTNASKR